MPDETGSCAEFPGGQRVRRAAALSAIYFVWGSTFLAIRYAVDTVPPLMMMGTRSLIAGAILYAVGTRGRWSLGQVAHWRSAAVAGGILFLGGHGLLSWAAQHTPSGQTALVFATMPIWMVIIRAVRKEFIPGWQIILGSVLGFAGVAALTLPERSLHGEAVAPVALAALMASALFWAIGSLYSRQADLPRSLALSTAMQLLCGGVLLVLVGVGTGEAMRLDLQQVSARSLLSMLYLICFGTLVAFIAYNWLLRRMEPSRVGSYAFVNPLVAVGVGAWIGGEVLDASMWLATVLVVPGVALIHYAAGSSTARANRRPRPNHLPTSIDT